MLAVAAVRRDRASPRHRGPGWPCPLSSSSGSLGSSRATAFRAREHVLGIAAARSSRPGRGRTSTRHCRCGTYIVGHEDVAVALTPTLAVANRPVQSRRASFGPRSRSPSPATTTLVFRTPERLSRQAREGIETLVHRWRWHWRARNPRKSPRAAECRALPLTRAELERRHRCCSPRPDDPYHTPSVRACARLRRG